MPYTTKNPAKANAKTPSRLFKSSNAMLPPI
jgi:hypothetical protein